MIMKCCICGCEIKGYGNNPDGAAWKDEHGNVIMPTYNIDAKCCDECDNKYVIPGRLYRLSKGGDSNAFQQGKEVRSSSSK